MMTKYIKFKLNRAQYIVIPTNHSIYNDVLILSLANLNIKEVLVDTLTKLNYQYLKNSYYGSIWHHPMEAFKSIIYL